MPYDYQAVEGEDKDKLVALASLYATYNLKMVEALHSFRIIREEILKTEENGKPISAAKADVLADATQQANEYERSRAHVQNIEMMIKALSFHADR